MLVKNNLFPFKEFHSPLKAAAVNLSQVQLKLVDEFNQKVRDNQIQLEEVPCLCGNTSFDLIASVDRYLMLQKTVICTRCGLIQSNPRMTEAEYRRFYTSDLYRKCYEGDNYLIICSNKYNSSYAKYIFDEVDKVKSIVLGVSVLELGAAGGWNLIPFIQAGARVSGIEYSPTLVKLGREHGINLTQGDINEIEGIFDVIILSHVLEHLSDPVGFLRNLSPHLKEESVVYISTPNIMNFNMGQLQNAHTYYFTPITLEYFCAEAGFKLIAKGPADKIHMFGIFKKGLTASSREGIKNHYTNVCFYLQRMKIKYFVKDVLVRLGLYR